MTFTLTGTGARIVPRDSVRYASTGGLCAVKRSRTAPIFASLDYVTDNAVSGPPAELVCSDGAQVHQSRTRAAYAADRRFSTSSNASMSRNRARPGGSSSIEDRLTAIRRPGRGLGPNDTIWRRGKARSRQDGVPRVFEHVFGLHSDDAATWSRRRGTAAPATTVVSDRTPGGRLRAAPAQSQTASWTTARRWGGPCRKQLRRAASRCRGNVTEPGGAKSGTCRTWSRRRATTRPAPTS